MGKLKEELAIWKAKLNALRDEWCHQQEHLDRAAREAGMRNSGEQASSSGAGKERKVENVGPVLSLLLWKCSQNGEAVDVIVNSDKLQKLVQISLETTRTYLDKYKNEFPAISEPESEEVISLLGLCTNMSATPIGLDFFLGNPLGQTVLDFYIESFKIIPMPSGLCMKRLMLMLLFNISLNSNGAAKFQDSIDVLMEIRRCLSDFRQATLHEVVLKLLVSITLKIDFPLALSTIKETVPPKLVEDIYQSTYATEEMKEQAQIVLGNIDRAEEKIKTMEEEREAALALLDHESDDVGF